MLKKLLKLSSLLKTKRSPKLHRWMLFSYCAHLDTFSCESTNDEYISNPIQILQSNRFTTSSSIESRSSLVESDLLGYCYDYDSESMEKLVRGVVRSSKRLFFEPKGITSLMVEEINAVVSKTQGSKLECQIEPLLREKEKSDTGEFCLNGSSVLMVMDSNDPYEDFKRSMEEMVEFHGVRDGEGLEELLSLYLVVNEKKNHEFILRAFVDLLSKHYIEE